MVRRRGLWLLLVWLMTAACEPLLAAEAVAALPSAFEVRDTLDRRPDPADDARAAQEGLWWEPTRFRVDFETPAAGYGERWIRYPSARPVGLPQNDRVCLECYLVRDAAGQPVRAPAVIVVHESGSAMHVGRIAAKALRQKGMHAYLIHLPFYGVRRPAGKRDAAALLKLGGRQAVADIRRARDVVAALPEVDPQNINLQGTSLGGFLTATTAGLDFCYDHVFITLAGGRLHDVLTRGDHEAAQLHAMLLAGGMTEETIRDLVWQIEPLRLAHRLDPARTWVHTATEDPVVPVSCANALVETARLPLDHHVKFWANHHNAGLYFPVLVNHMVRQIVPPQPAPLPVAPAGSP